MDARNYIGGKWVDAHGTYENLSPNSGRSIGRAPQSDSGDVADAVDAARAALPAWAHTAVDDRAAIIRRASNLLREEYGDEGKQSPLKCMINDEMGKRIPEADIEVIETSDILQFYADQGPRCLKRRRLALDKQLWPTKESTILFEPVGVIGVIKPWNYPLELPIWSIGAALVCGNTVVFKPSELTPLIATQVVALFTRAGLPPGVLNLVCGDGASGAALVDHGDVDMISFTGSAPVGTEIAIKCATHLRRVSLELGGKDAMLVLPDADIHLASEGALWGAFTNCGQVCVGVRRLLLHTSLKSAFLDLLLKKTQGLRLGIDLAPLASKAQLTRVEEHVQDAISRGATLLAGGRRPASTQIQDGFFYLPTILSDVTPEMLVHTDDTFGPVLAVYEFSDLDDALQLAHHPDYDLGASIWTQDPARAVELAERLKTGIVWINDVNVAFPQAPWTGRSRSGHGIELSELSLNEYSVVKHLSIETGSEPRRPWWFPYT